MGQRKTSAMTLKMFSPHSEIEADTYDHEALTPIISPAMATNSIKLLTGNSHPELAKLVADRLGIELTKIMVLQYSNQETSVTIGESVRDEDGVLCFSFAYGDMKLTLNSESSSSNPPLLATSMTASWNSSSSSTPARLHLPVVSPP